MGLRHSSACDPEALCAPWQKGENLNADVAKLVKKGLPVDVQQALDAVRVIGNEALHPGQMDLRDDRPTAERRSSW